ncbi:MAG: GAF domain-containing protein [Atopobiaceae bacterium]|jgi:GAF domain-containing protein|nr:GAF domain-containing protein [Atopobiaceae bacterium]MCI2051568.1 GAF domain-containing protein [Atopobiaceae bacterium]
MTDYELLREQIISIAEADPAWYCFLPNASALIYEELDCVSWAGFYLMKAGQLVLGPFQGKVACVHIPLGKGVCGTAAAEDAIQVVPDVHLFPGHIACDSDSQSEIVVPIHSKGKLVGVLDIDSTFKNRFTTGDAEGLAMVARTIGEVCDFGSIG